MTLFKKILYPTDFSENSIDSMTCALELAKNNGAELTIFYIDRISNKTKNPALYVSLEKDMRDKAYETFNEISNVMRGLSDINYKLDFGIGDLYDRIKGKVETDNIDLVVINRELQNRLESIYQAKSGIIFTELRCPVLILPSCRPKSVKERVMESA